MHIHDTLRHFAHVIRQSISLILLGVLLGTGITGTISLKNAPIYEARALIKVNDSPTATINDVFHSQAMAVGYALLITTPEVLQAAAKEVPGTNTSLLSRDVNASPLDNTELIEIRAQIDNAREAAAIANAVAQNFIEIQVTHETQSLQIAQDQAAQDITQTRNNMDNAQQKLAQLQISHADSTIIAQQKSLLDTYQSNYMSSLNNYNQLQTQKLQVANMLSIAQAATPPDGVVNPQLALILLLGGCGSLLLMLTFVLAWDWINKTIKTTDDVIRLAGLEPMVSIPASKSAVTSAQLLNITTGNYSAIKDGFSLLGARFRRLNTGQQTILVTGLHTHIGTTTTALHLALSLARSGTKVLLVDANLHRPALHTIFKHTNIAGLTNHVRDVRRFAEQPVLYPRSWLDQWKTTITNLWVVPSGPPVPHPATLLTMPELRQLKDWLLGKNPACAGRAPLVDLIIFDTAALEKEIDTQALADIAEATVLVIEAAKEHPGTLDKANRLLERLGAPLLGVVINRQRSTHLSYLYIDQQTLHEKITPAPSTADKHQAVTELSADEMKPYTMLPITPLPLSVVRPASDLPSKHPTKKTEPTRTQFRSLLRAQEASYANKENEQKL